MLGWPAHGWPRRCAGSAWIRRPSRWRRCPHRRTLSAWASMGRRRSSSTAVTGSPTRTARPDCPAASIRPRRGRRVPRCGAVRAGVTPMTGSSDLHGSGGDEPSGRLDLPDVIRSRPRFRAPPQLLQRRRAATGINRGLVERWVRVLPFDVAGVGSIAGELREVHRRGRPRKAPDPVDDFLVAGRQPSPETLTGLTVDRRRGHRPGMHVQANTPTLTEHRGLPHISDRPTAGTRARQPTRLRERGVNDGRNLDGCRRSKSGQFDHSLVTSLRQSLSR
jgi:hypothetical protein